MANLIKPIGIGIAAWLLLRGDKAETAPSPGKTPAPVRPPPKPFIPPKTVFPPAITPSPFPGVSGEAASGAGSVPITPVPPTYASPGGEVMPYEPPGWDYPSISESDLIAVTVAADIANAPAVEPSTYEPPGLSDQQINDIVSQAQDDWAAAIATSGIYEALSNGGLIEVDAPVISINEALAPDSQASQDLLEAVESLVDYGAPGVYEDIGYDPGAFDDPYWDW